MPVLCVLVAGAVRATLPGDAMTVSWTHSVQRTQWEEHYRLSEGGIVLEQARVQGSGAGMEAGEHAVRRDGWWTWQPQLRLYAVTLTRSSYAGDYTICSAAGCTTLAQLTGPTAEGAAVVIAPCTGEYAPALRASPDAIRPRP
ncbi:MAG: DUF1850 domain-containing protein [Casimicrobiaceae bacterium]